MLKKAENKIILEDTGFPYDGVDEVFELLLLPISYGDKLEVCDKSQHAKVSFIEPGELFYHVGALTNICLNELFYSLQPVKDINDFMFLIKYIIKWVNIQREKIERFCESPNKNLKNHELSEFHLSVRKFKGTIKDFTYTSLVFENLQVLLIKLSTYFPKEEIVDSLAQSLSKMQKVFRVALVKDPILSTKKHLPTLTKTLDVIEFEGLFAQLFSRVSRGEYLLAEAFANKCLFKIRTLHKSEHVFWNVFIYSVLAYIAAKLNDNDMLLKHIDSALKVTSLEIDDIQTLQGYGLFSQACEAAATYYKEAGDYEKSIKFYQEAIKFTNNAQLIVSYNESLRSLNQPLVEQLARTLKSDEYKTLFADIKCYPSNCRFDLYFESTPALEKCLSILKKHNLVPARVPKLENVLAFVIDSNFDIDTFYKVLSFLVNLQFKEKNKKLKLEKKQHREQVNAVEKKSTSQNADQERAVIQTWPHPKKAQTKTRKPKAQNIPIITVDRWDFLGRRRAQPLEKVEFLKMNREFNPAVPNGVVTLRVDGHSGRWFACMNPRVVQELNALYPGEGSKLEKLFNSAIELSNDCCVPCYKEMKHKSDQLGVDLPYIFKIRLLGKGGLGNVRVYASIIDQTKDGKKLVAFTAINPNSHDKHSRPVHYEMLDDEVLRVIMN